jgi:thymidylate kinase
MGKDFFDKIVSGYEKCEKLEMMKKRFIRIDSNRDPESIFQDIISKITL